MTTQDYINHALAVHEAGGRMAIPELPTQEAWNAMLEQYAPGCGSPTHVIGTNGGMMPCGAELTDLRGHTAKYFCAACEESMAKDQKEEK